MSIFARANELKKKRSNKKGFTLVELVVVLVILAILMAILVPSLVGYINKAKNKQVEANARAVYIAAQATVAELLKNNDTVTSEQVEDKLPQIYELAEVNDLVADTNSPSLVGGTENSKFEFDSANKTQKVYSGVKISGFKWIQGDKQITMENNKWGEVVDKE
ncbi:MAG: prepilin-type N-terminal cleavage/methylation domain-containing protein [Blautia sp.]|jgi:prepilin-type N-terminal cleavage/methylation domain-containing protein